MGRRKTPSSPPLLPPRHRLTRGGVSFRPLPIPLLVACHAPIASPPRSFDNAFSLVPVFFAPLLPSPASPAELLTLRAEYSWAGGAGADPAASLVPPLWPTLWDPRVLRGSHILVVAHATPAAGEALGGGEREPEHLQSVRQARR